MHIIVLFFNYNIFGHGHFPSEGYSYGGLDGIFVPKKSMIAANQIVNIPLNSYL